MASIVSSSVGADFISIDISDAGNIIPAFGYIANNSSKCFYILILDIICGF